MKVLLRLSEWRGSDNGTVRSIVYTSAGPSSVLRLEERELPEPGEGEVRVRVVVSGVNPTDWKARASSQPHGVQVPGQDGAGVVDAVGPGVDSLAVGDRVWLWDAAWQRPEGTTQEYVVLPVRHAVRLPQEVAFDVGASLGIPALTAHRALTVAEGAPAQLAPGALDGTTVLVAGGAGAVGHAAIQLARWAGARVLTTVSGAAKGELARLAGAHEIVDYRATDATAELQRLAPEGVDVVAEVAPTANGRLDVAVLKPGGTIAIYASDAEALSVPIRPSMTKNVRWQFILTYTTTTEQKDAAVAAVAQAAADGALQVGKEHGLPLTRFPFERAAAAHDAVEHGAVGKVLIDVGDA